MIPGLPGRRHIVVNPLTFPPICMNTVVQNHQFDAYITAELRYIHAIGGRIGARIGAN